MELEFARIEITCPMCELVDRHLVRELIGTETANCPNCGHEIDITTDDLTARIAAAAGESS